MTLGQSYWYRAKAKSKPDIKLLIIGSGPLRSEIEKFIKRNRLEESVKFSGWLETVKDVSIAYNQSKVFINPSYNEGGPRVALEAMACGLPVITTKVGLMLDIIEEKQNGLFIDWEAEDIAKKILWTLTVQNEKLREEMAEEGYKTVPQFERKKAIENYAKNYQKIPIPP